MPWNRSVIAHVVSLFTPTGYNKNTTKSHSLYGAYAKSAPFSANFASYGPYMTYTKSVQYSGSSVLTDVGVRVSPRALEKCYAERITAFLKSRKAFSLPFWSAGYNKNTTVSEGQVVWQGGFGPDGRPYQGQLSRWRGTGCETPVFGLRYQSCLPP